MGKPKGNGMRSARGHTGGGLAIVLWNEWKTLEGVAMAFRNKKPITVDRDNLHFGKRGLFQ